MSLISVRLDDIIRHVNEQGYSLSYVLTPNLGRSAKSVGIKRYSSLMKSSGTFGNAELQEALAAARRLGADWV